MTTVRFKIDLRPGPRQVRPTRPSAPSTSSAPVSTAARTLALAHFIEREVRAGRWKSYREAAAALGVCHARAQHVVGLVLLPPGVQAAILLGTSAPAEGAMRTLASRVEWQLGA